MKNIHILPTDKPSRLFKASGELKLTRKFDFYNGAIYQNIYITSDEEIKGEDWCYNSINNNVYKKEINKLSFAYEYKIILTTDQSLDGVQAIDDEFLEWFVKNPSCEEVKVRKNPKVHFIVKGKGVKGFNQGYKIIIPKEEILCKYCLSTTTCCDDVEAETCENYPKEELKQESLEEAAKRIYGTDKSKDVEYYAFINGAKWQAERSCSEAIEFGKWLDENMQQREYYPMMTMAMEELFEQFKKK